MQIETPNPQNWVDFFNGPHSLYVNPRHAWLHAHDLAHALSPLVPEGARVLDYACGATQAADVLARRCKELVLWDAAAQVQIFLQNRYGAQAGITLWSDDALGASDIPFDVVILHSLSQYLSPVELEGLLARACAALSPRGFILLGDVVGPEVTPLHDAYALLRYGFESGFFWAAVGGLLKTAFSRYRHVRRSFGFYHYSHHDVFQLAKVLNLSAERLPRNMGHNPYRDTFLLRVCR